MATRDEQIAEVVVSLSDSLAELGALLRAPKAEPAPRAMPVQPAQPAKPVQRNLSISERWEKLFANQGFRYFVPAELVYRGGQHHDKNSAAHGKNTFPPESVWLTMMKIGRVVDEIRHRLGEEIHVISAFRSIAYNKIIGGVADSQHIKGRAMDILSPTADAETVWKIAKQLRDEGFFKGGIGRYNSFTHVDVRGWNTDWDNRK